MMNLMVADVFDRKVEMVSTINDAVLLRILNRMEP